MVAWAAPSRARPPSNCFLLAQQTKACLPSGSLARQGPKEPPQEYLSAEWQVGEAGYESRSANCAFDGREMRGRVRMTIAAGAVAYRERSFAIGAVPA